MDGSVVAAWEQMLATDADPLTVAKAAEAVIGFCHARQLQALAQLSEEADLGADPDGVVVDPTSAEVACAMRWTPGAASARVDLAWDVVSDLPCVLQALAGGLIDLGTARVIANGTCELDPARRTALAEKAITYAKSHTVAQVRVWLVRQIDRLDPDVAAQRRKKARRHRGVQIRPELDGMATITALLTAEEAAACMESIRVRSNNIDGGRAANQADTFVELLTGISAADPVPITVILTDDGADLEGYGPISDAHASELLNRTGTTLIRLYAPAMCIGYAPSLGMRRYVTARDRHCRFPGCRRPARACDLDHLTPWPAGKTTADNLHALCRHHHRLKTHSRWTVTKGRHRDLIWTSPRGHIYISYDNDP